MVAIPILNTAGTSVGSYEFDTTELAETVNRQLLHDVVVMYEANQRLGSHRTKSKGEVSYSTKKLYRQKGTGRARAGSRKSGVRRGGGHIHHLRPRDYSFKMNKKAVRAALRMAMLSKIEDQQLLLLDSFTVSSPQTKPVATILAALGTVGTSLLIGTEGEDRNLFLSARNIPKVSVKSIREFNAYSILRPKHVLLTRSGFEAFVQQAKDLREGVKLEPLAAAS